MAQNLANKKLDFAAKLAVVSVLVLQLKPKIDMLVADYFGEGYNAGGAAPLLQTDLTPPSDYLTPAVIANIITDLQAIQGVLTGPVIQQFQQSVPTLPF